MNGKFGKRAAHTLAAALAAALLAGMAAVSAEEIPRVPYAAAGAETKTDAAASVRAKDSYRIVAFGDSLTAGYEYGMDQMDVMPVPYGYVDRLFEQALFRGRAEMYNYGILGLQTIGLKNFLAAVERDTPVTEAELGQEKPLPDPRAAAMLKAVPETRAALSGADLVAVMIGGNDFSPVIGLIGNPAEAELWLTGALEAYESSLEASIRSIAAVNPKARIVVGDVYSPVPKKTGLIGVEPEVYDRLQAVAGRVTERLEAVTARLSMEGLQVKPAFPSKAFVGREAAFTAIVASRGQDIHPSQSGYQAIGEAFAEAVWGETRAVAPRDATTPISVVVGGREVLSEFKPVVKNNRTFLVLRDIADAMKATTRWEGKTQKATVLLGGTTVELTIGAKTMRVNGRSVPVDVPAFLQRSGSEIKTYVPLAALSDGLGFQVEYRAKLKAAFINE